ncbi:MAG: primosomal protein N' [Planctomycetes bacterium]|nr:primosomal protein N' [Planctomycetota bacterium]
MGKSRAEQATGHLWIEEGERHEGLIADVAPLIPSFRTYSFAVPTELSDVVQIGHRVMVPIGKRGRLVRGFVAALDRREWDSTLRPIDSVLDSQTFLTPELVELGREIAVHYHCPLGRTLQAMTPEAVRRQRGFRRVRVARLALSIDEIRQSGTRLTAQREALVNRLAESSEFVPVDRLLQSSGVSTGVLRALVRQGWVEVESRKELTLPTDPETPIVDPTFELNADQRAAIAAIESAMDAAEFCVTLLFGVSGSGKTEVYIQAMRRAIEAGKQAILLVPEIVLTTQLVQRLAQRFSHVALHHSALTDVQRSIMWQQVAAGRKSVVIGTRSAVFAPCPDLGLICVDEEQESSYKNLQAPRFHVRDVAILRAQRLGIPVVLGSATPSVETWYNSETRAHYRRLALPSRVNDLPMPTIHLVDMRDEFAEQKRMVVMSRTMERLLGETLERKEQAILMVNRRGYANRVFCPACKSRLTCPNCNVSLVVHTAGGVSICHYCRTRTPTPTRCANVACNEPLVQMGMGTQRVEEVLTTLFPQARVRRVDSDTMRHRDQYRQLVDDFTDRKIDILIGTQMIAKGLDFPFVSFVGVVDADTNVMIGDFRAHEKLFHLVTQVAGRAGRADTPGQVVVQTSTPELPALQFALTHDYEGFVKEELEIRRRVALPPFRRVTRIVLTHVRSERVRREAEALAERINGVIESLGLEYADVLGPNPCALSRLRGKYRFDLLVRAKTATAMRRLLGELETNRALTTKAESTMVDVDPVSLT